MYFLILLSHLIFTNLELSSEYLFNFNVGADQANWYIVDDVVMGGRSDGHFKIDAGIGIFSGKVSLENYGGFSSVRYQFDAKDISKYKKCKIKLKGDGKAYQFRVKTNHRDRYSYKLDFQTSGSAEIIEIPLADMFPTFRGRKLDMPNFPAEQLAEISFMISNKKAEAFRLELEWMTLEE